MKAAEIRVTTQGIRVACAAATQYAGRVRRYLLSRLRGRAQEVDDVAQEVYLRLLRIPEETLIRQPPAYILRVAAGVISDFCESQRRRAAIVLDTESGQDLSDLIGEDDPAGDLQLRRELERAIARLPATHQAVLILHERDGYTYKETALRLRLSVDTVHKYLVESKSRLRDML